MNRHNAGAEDFPLPAEVDYDGISFTYEHPDHPTRNSFLPWHRPRKQYVREYQWSTAVREVMERRDADDKLKYVGLPGIDLLDLRQILRTVCEPSGRKLQYIGFDMAAGSDSPDGIELNISQSELDARTSVHKPSGVRPDDLRYIGKRTTNAWRAVRNFGHVDVVNFDLTTTLFSGSPDEPISYLGALKEILALQSGNPKPWVLLATTKVDRQDMTDAAVGPLLGLFRDSLADCSGLVEAISDANLSISDEIATDAWDDDSLRVTSLAATLQWIRGLLNDGAMSARVRLTSCFVYTSFEGGGAVDMASMVIRFDPRPTDLVDAVFSGPETEANAARAADGLGIRAASEYTRIANGINIDHRLRGDQELRTRMTVLAADLMEEARYSRPEYLVWANTATS